jgi:hypothetical protein
MVDTGFIPVEQTDPDVANPDVRAAWIAVDDVGSISVGQRGPRCSTGGDGVAGHRRQIDVTSPFDGEQLPGAGEPGALWPIRSQLVEALQLSNHLAPIIIARRGATVDPGSHREAADTAGSRSSRQRHRDDETATVKMLDEVKLPIERRFAATRLERNREAIVDSDSRHLVAHPLTGHSLDDDVRAPRRHVAVHDHEAVVSCTSA